MALLNRKKKDDKAPESKANAEFALRQKLKVQHFQTPEMLCEFVNNNLIDPEAIVPFDRFQAVYYYEK